MNRPEGFDLSHPYAPSVIATYLGASNLISAVKTIFDQETELSVRFLHFWFNTFSAVVCFSFFLFEHPLIITITRPRCHCLSLVHHPHLWQP